jgi:hypothetical protein
VLLSKNRVAKHAAVSNRFAPATRSIIPIRASSRSTAALTAAVPPTITIRLGFNLDSGARVAAGIEVGFTNNNGASALAAAAEAATDSGIRSTG